jgi:uncharacterized protein
MFPLGSVVVPGMVLPLHVFEMRYRRLVRDCLAGDGELGVVLIERGSEVGGGDVRTDVGTVVRVVQAEELEDGRFVLAGVGVRRLRVVRWLDDDPYPRAEVDDWPDPDHDDAPAGPVAEVVALLRRSAALRAELGDPAPPLDVELTEDVATASYQATALAAFGPADTQALLCAPSVTDRLALLRELLGDQIGLLEARLASG